MKPAELTLVEPSKLCIYCARAIQGKRSKEHLVPKALGCKVTIPRVCSECNNQVLSELDNELVSCAPLRILAWEQLSRTAEDVWDYDEKRDLALEARALPGYSGCAVWPQVVLEEDRPVFRFDPLDVPGGDYDAYFPDVGVAPCVSRPPLSSAAPRTAARP